MFGLLSYTPRVLLKEQKGMHVHKLTRDCVSVYFNIETYFTDLIIASKYGFENTSKSTGESFPAQLSNS